MRALHDWLWVNEKIVSVNVLQTGLFLTEYPLLHDLVPDIYSFYERSFNLSEMASSVIKVLYRKKNCRIVHRAENLLLFFYSEMWPIS